MLKIVLSSQTKQKHTHEKQFLVACIQYYKHQLHVMRWCDLASELSSCVQQSKHQWHMEILCDLASKLSYRVEPPRDYVGRTHLPWHHLHLEPSRVTTYWYGIFSIEATWCNVNSCPIVFLQLGPLIWCHLPWNSSSLNVGDFLLPRGSKTFSVYVPLLP